MKEYLAIRLNWDPGMTEEDFYDHMLEYLYMYYGDGNEELFDFITVSYTHLDVYKRQVYCHAE